MDKKDTRVIVKRILKDYIYKHKVKLLVSFFCMALVAAATAGNAWLMQPVLDEIFINKNHEKISNFNDIIELTNQNSFKIFTNYFVLFGILVSNRQR